MNNIIVTDAHGNNWKRVNKLTARKHYERDKTIILCPHKLLPFGHWQCGNSVLREYDVSRSFDNHCLYNTWFNCVDKQTGFYLAYYVKV